MKAFPWLIAGLSIGAAAVAFLYQMDDAAASYADPDVERAAYKSGAWGAKQRVKGAGNNLIGMAKQKIGEATGNYDLANEGAGDQTIGHLRDAAGKVADKVSDTLHDLNRS
jgi:uncharacterized protein YjbJ (UPF0337 family)